MGMGGVGIDGMVWDGMGCPLGSRWMCVGGKPFMGLQEGCRWSSPRRKGDGMIQDGMGWNGMGRYGMDGMGGIDGMGCDGMRGHGMVWDWMGRDEGDSSVYEIEP